MPEATAIIPSPVKPEQSAEDSKETWVKYNDQGQIDFQKSVQQKLSAAGIQHNPVPVTERELPIHVPDGSTVNTTLKDIPQVSGAYGDAKTPLSGLSGLSEHLDYADQLVTGRSHVIDAAHRFTTQKDEKEEKRLKEANRPKKISRGPIKKFVAWLHDEVPQSDRSVIHAEERFTKQKESKKAA